MRLFFTDFKCQESVAFVFKEDVTQIPIAFGQMQLIYTDCYNQSGKESHFLFPVPRLFYFGRLAFTKLSQATLRLRSGTGIILILVKLGEEGGREFECLKLEFTTSVV